jgi:hypothetical protein
MIRDRGKVKWMPALMVPEHRALLRDVARNELRQAKPVIDEYELEEFDRKICEAMEFNQAVMITKWADGFSYEETGRVHYVDPVRKEVRMVTEDDAVVRIAMADIIGVKVVED